MNHLAGADMEQHLSFMEATEQFHEKKRLYFYPRIFGDQPVKEENWQAFKVEKFQNRVEVRWVNTFAPLLLAIFLFLYGASIGLRKIVWEG
jgi:ABC-2 type transport system permease protein